MCMLFTYVKTYVKIHVIFLCRCRFSGTCDTIVSYMVGYKGICVGISDKEKQAI